MRPDDPAGAADDGRTIRIFGRDVRLEPGGSRAGRILIEELAGYPASRAAPSLTVAVVDSLPMIGAINPSSHAESRDTFVAAFPGVTVRCVFGAEHLERIDLAMAARRGLRQDLARWRSRQFTDPESLVGQKFHEIAMMLAVMADPALALVHGAAVALDGRAIVIGGTGGVGKTTLGIELGLRHGAAFLADDLTVVDRSGVIHPNLAFPKIYAYNMRRDRELTRRVFAGRPLDDRLQWHSKRLRRDASARRRIEPAILYGSIAGPTPFARYLILVREERGSMSVEPVDGATAAAMSVDVLRAELDGIARHLWWHRYHRRLVGEPPSLDAEAIFDRWRGGLQATLANVECVAVRIPLGMPIDDYRRRMVELVLG